MSFSLLKASPQVLLLFHNFLTEKGVDFSFAACYILKLPYLSKYRFNDR